MRWTTLAERVEIGRGTLRTDSGACRDDPSETCTYNDSSPAMMFAVAIFCVACAIRSRIIYFER